MSDVIWALQRALYTHLTQQGEIQSLLGTPARIYDDAPGEAIFPHVILGAGNVRELAGVSGALVHEVRLAAYSDYAGRREIKEIICALYDVLHEADFAVHGARLVNLRFVFSDIFERRERGLYQGVMRFRAVTEPLLLSA